MKELLSIIIGVAVGGAGMLIYLAHFTKSTITFKGK